jgi:hypothetical protein
LSDLFIDMRTTVFTKDDTKETPEIHRGAGGNELARDDIGDVFCENGTGDVRDMI